MVFWWVFGGCLPRIAESALALISVRAHFQLLLHQIQIHLFFNDYIKMTASNDESDVVR